MLTQQEADTFLAMPKHVFGAPRVVFPEPGETITLDLRSADDREFFQLDIERGRRIQEKWKLQLRYRETTILLRLDIGGSGHSNPDKAPNKRLSTYEGIVIPAPHLQQYVEGYHDGWATPPLPQAFTNTNDVAVTWSDFLRYCQIDYVPLQGGLL